MTYYSVSAVDEFVARCCERGQEVYTVPGCLCDSYIVLPDDKYKGAIIKECYLNEWASAQTIRFFTEISRKTQKIVELIEQGQEDAAAELLYH